MVNIIAHRGYSSQHLENTLPAFQAAYRFGVWGVELDVHLTRDGELVIFHDESLKRLANRPGLVSDYTLAELQQVGLSKGPLTGKLLSLRAYLAWLADKDMVTNIEIKRKNFIPDGIEAKVIELVETYDQSDSVIISSFSHQTLAKVRQLKADLHIAYLFNERNVETLRQLDDLKPNYVHPRYDLLDQDFVSDLHQSGYQINTYTVNQEADISRMVNFGVDGIITDYPNRV